MNLVIHEDFRDSNIFRPFFGLESQIIRIIIKKRIIALYSNFLMIVKNDKRKYKIFLKVIQNFYMNNIQTLHKNNPPEAAKVAPLVKFFNVGKT